MIKTFRYQISSTNSTIRRDFAKRNLFWHPYDAKLYDGLKGALHVLHGRAWGERLRGLLHFVALLPRMFKD